MTYANVRAETHVTRDYLVLTLWKYSGVQDVWEDGSDLIQITFKNGAKVMIHLIDDEISAHELQKMISENHANGVHSLMMFWAELLLPRDGERYTPDSWMQAMLALYGDNIYSYEVSSKEVFLFPVYFHAQAGRNDRLVRWGKTLSLAHLRMDTLHLESVHLQGQFRRVYFEASTSKTDGSAIPPSSFAAISATLQSYYTLLQLPLTATAEEVRQAYRTLARQYHPDLNPDPAAHEQMQEINLAYAQVMAQFEE